jgi:hypothetical protein
MKANRFQIIHLVLSLNMQGGNLLSAQEIGLT